MQNDFLRRYVEWVDPYLYILYNASNEQKRVPDDRLVAKVVPTHKCGDQQKVENYRPISITSVCYKLLEHIIAKGMHTYLESTKTVFPNQHGFRQIVSTVTQLIEAIDDFTRALNNSVQIDGICLNFSKAFDKVPHKDLTT
ncbi:hypothetical protein HPB48_020315 [Haemaphysalis longicornis]|uniref:Reverse transcriptase domain-containing protein n=1 Tax=Haemaphysalis longicornis TaxID=44386 RepID=A0A9J6GU46_HAELO|nr:hypothetical protein HPB48_020315 [Haemaphysalis longicornis]